MKKINGKAILGGVAGLGLLTLSIFGLLKKNEDEVEVEVETVYDKDDLEVVDSDDTYN